jgi:hypothetical protein
VPNPTHENITVVFPTALEIKSARIIDLSGKYINELSPENYTDRFTVDVSHLKTGAYFIQISDDKSRITKKFVKN